MLKTLGSTESLAWPDEGGVRIGGGDNRTGRNSRCKLDRNEIGDSKIDSNEVGDDKIEKKVQKIFKSKKTVRSDFLTFGARLAFTKLR